MRIKEWITAFERVVPLMLQEEWDRCGLQIGRTDRELTGVILAMDVTDAVMNAAIERGCNLILTHHPMLFRGVRRISDADVPNVQRIMSALEHGLCVYSAHTNLDAVDGGVNSVLAERLNLTELSALAAYPESDARRAYSTGMGRIGWTPEVTLDTFAKQVKSALGLTHCLVYGDGTQPVKRVAVLGGSGMDYAQDALRCGADVLVTADIKYHDALDALEQGLMLIDAGHYGTEAPVLHVLEAMSLSITGDGCRHHIIEQVSTMLRRSL